jgi:hypothetical protein
MGFSVARVHSITADSVGFEPGGYYSCPFVSWCVVSLCLSISELVLKVLPQAGQGTWPGFTPLIGVS